MFSGYEVLGAAFRKYVGKSLGKDWAVLSKEFKQQIKEDWGEVYFRDRICPNIAQLVIQNNEEESIFCFYLKDNKESKTELDANSINRLKSANFKKRHWIFIKTAYNFVILKGYKEKSAVFQDLNTLTAKMSESFYFFMKRSDLGVIDFDNFDFEGYKFTYPIEKVLKYSVGSKKKKTYKQDLINFIQGYILLGKRKYGEFEGEWGQLLREFNYRKYKFEQGEAEFPYRSFCVLLDQALLLEYEGYPIPNL